MSSSRPVSPDPVSARLVCVSRLAPLRSSLLSSSALALLPALLLALLSTAAVAPALGAEEPSPGQVLAELTADALGVSTPTRSAAEYEAAAATYRSVLERLADLDRDALGPEAAIDADLLERHARVRLFEIEDLELYRLQPVSYLALGATDSLFVRPCGAGARAVRRAVEELERFPEVVAHGRENLTRPARVWTENALYTAWYARKLLTEHVPEACVPDPELKAELVAAAGPALEALDGYVRFLEEELLARSDRSPAWAPEEIEVYQFVGEGLEEWGVDAMLALAREEEIATRAEMEALAKRIHPSGDLRTVWELMKEETPPWEEVEPMAERYVEMAAAWLRGPGARIVDIPERFDYGVALASPMARRILSFGGANYGPTVGGRISGYYILTPLESRLSEEERASRLVAYNPYWTHVISYHEWLGHNVQRAVASANLDAAAHPMRAAYRGQYLSQAWSFYLEKLLEDEGYYEVLPHVEALKTRMARLQMRMWRIQRILTKLGMATGETSFDEAVQAYVDEIGMEPTNAFIEVQRDSQSPSPPGREIVGERVILEMRQEYARRMGEHDSLKAFHEALLSHGELPLPVIERLMLGD